MVENIDHFKNPKCGRKYGPLQEPAILVILLLHSNYTAYLKWNKQREFKPNNV